MHLSGISLTHGSQLGNSASLPTLVSQHQRCLIRPSLRKPEMCYRLAGYFFFFSFFSGRCCTWNWLHLYADDPGVFPLVSANQFAQFLQEWLSTTRQMISSVLSTLLSWRVEGGHAAPHGVPLNNPYRPPRGASPPPPTGYLSIPPSRPPRGTSPPLPPAPHGVPLPVRQWLEPSPPNQLVLQLRI